MEKRAGIRDVARAAGVSISTVSRVFSHPEIVSETTRKRVLEIADKYDFKITRTGTMLKSGHTFRAALLMNESITSWFNTQVFAGLDSILHDKGYDISLFQHIDSAESRERFFTNLPVLRNVDMVFVASFAVEPEEAEQLRRTHVPIVGINVPQSTCFDATISIDDEGGMERATQHLIRLGHRHIVYTCSQPAPTIDSSIDARERGFIKACKNAEKSIPDLKWNVLRVPRGQQFADFALAAVLAEEEFPDAICCQMDMMALPLMMKLQHFGHQTPRDYSIIGFDDAPYADTFGLTTMHQDPYEMGAQAARFALQLINEEPIEDPFRTVEPSLILRSTDERQRLAKKQQ
ncbi:LacI family transcription regulator [Bifidobacterium dolichotidis]|uniref:LacI family transcription regulator n=1 Tax=Bifidobacterium dolichotidis TaxID=2306976 RepID=A0A430FL05_9BIFI|nr:LacI family DNA-binding transcriptional regulator [Bifidobacterium dolichotidis]RSX53388.1 LacI family transcription regulator [Bifidobacterium dolichotidis]